MMTTVKIIRKITGHLCRTVTVGHHDLCPPVPSRSVLTIYNYHALCFRTDEIQAQRGCRCCLRSHSWEVAQQGVEGGGLLPSLPSLLWELLENRAHGLPLLVSTSASEAAEAQCRAWGMEDGGLHGAGLRRPDSGQIQLHFSG